jgi:DNA-binding XRE family transcriptional regulator
VNAIWVRAPSDKGYKHGCLSGSEPISLPVEVKIMKADLTLVRETSMGFKARKIRISKLLIQQELADMAGVSREEVDLFERNLPVPLDARRRILKELWAMKVRNNR